MNMYGQPVDFGTVEQPKPEPLVEGRTAQGVPARDTKLDIAASSPLDAIGGLVRNLSWGFNSALFALPDAAYQKLAESYGLKGDQITSLTKLFNKGESTPRNTSERFARAIGDGVGTTLPFTGILGAMAAARPVVALAAAPQAGVKGILKGIADDTLNYIKANPVKAAATDIAFGSAYESLKQAVQEGIDDDNPNKEMLKEYLPAAAFLGPAAWYTLSPVTAAAKAANAIRGKLGAAGDTAGLGEAQKEALASLPAGYRLPVINIYPKMMLKRAEEKLANTFGPMAETPEVRESLNALEQAFKDPRFSEIFTVDGRSTFDFAEQAMYGPITEQKKKMLSMLPPSELANTKAREAANQERMTQLWATLRPEARKPVEEAFRAAQADHQEFFENMLRQQKDLTEVEIAAISERLGPQDPNNMGAELRGVIANGLELDYGMRKKILNKMGLNVGYSPEGIPVATRDGGTSLFPAQDMEKAAIALVEKYKIERPSLRARIPEPIQLLDRFLTSQKFAREKMEKDMTSQLVNQSITEQMANFGTTLPPDFQKAIRNEVMRTVRGESAKESKRFVKAADIAPDATGNITIPSGIPGKKFVINPAQIKADAARIAEANTPVDINAPEALDYLASAQRFRNDSLLVRNDAMKKGRMRFADVDRYIKTGDAVYKDIEKLILDHVPKISQNYGNITGLLDDYRAGFEQVYPLLVTQKIRGGETYLLPNEEVMSTAFKNAESLQQLQLTLGTSPQAESLVRRGTIDWLRGKGVVNQQGLVDPSKIRSVLDKNQNIVNALPANIQAEVKNEVALAESYVTRLGELDKRAVIAKDSELKGMLDKAARDDADPLTVLEQALSDPASMRKLVDQFSKDPESLAALRRSVYDVAMQGSEKGGSLLRFIDQNEKSLRVLYKDTQHFDDLKMLADIDRRVNAMGDVTGRMASFEATDEKMKRLFGFGIQFATTTLREAATGRISPETGALALMLRLAGRVESQLYQRMFTKAMEDPKFAHSITHIGTPQQATTINGALQNIGIDLTKAYEAPRAPAPSPTQRVLRQEGAGALRPEQETRPAPTAEQMLRAMPPAVASRGYTNQMRVGPPPSNPGGGLGNVQLMYPAMFPNDPISGLLQQRQAQLTGQQK
jgi:hypothetical protein